MKKLWLLLVAIAIGVAIVWWLGARAMSWVWADEAVAKSAAQPWPGGMGTLESVAARFPPLHASDAAVKLTALANALPKNEASDDFVLRQIARGEMTIEAPPTLADVSAMRDLLLHEPLVWQHRGGLGEVGDQETQARRVTHMTMARSLVASALAKARANDLAAWDELHAVWNLARSLDPQPQMLTQTSAFAMARMINAVAWKMPLPAPAWFAELQQRDYVRRLLEAFQALVASYWESGARMLPTKWLAQSVEHDRQIAEALFKETRCEVNAVTNDLGVDLSSVWRRAFRYRAELEATANALRVREGQSIVTSSRCTGGSWTFDGTTVRFSRDIATSPPDRPMPLALRVKQ